MLSGRKQDAVKTVLDTHSRHVTLRLNLDKLHTRSKDANKKDQTTQPTRTRVALLLQRVQVNAV